MHCGSSKWPLDSCGVCVRRTGQSLGRRAQSAECIVQRKGVVVLSAASLWSSVQMNGSVILEYCGEMRVSLKVCGS